MLKSRMPQLCYFLLALFSLTYAAGATTFPYVVAYGDSLSDNGNVFAATGFPPPPYFAGRVSNGPVAVERAAALLNAQLMDFAWGGATTGIGNTGDGGTPTSAGLFNLPGMQPVFQSSLSAVAPIATTALFIVWGGADDFISPSPLDATPLAAANRAVANIVGMVSTLQGLGAQDILVPGLPDLGLTPRIRALGPAASAEASALTDYFNAALLTALPNGVTYVDAAGVLRSMVANPAAFGFTNVTSPCLSTLLPCATPDQYLFWDDIHPSAHAHEIFGAALAAAAVPEPATAALFLIAAATLFAIRRRK